VLKHCQLIDTLVEHFESAMVGLDAQIDFGDEACRIAAPQRKRSALLANISKHAVLGIFYRFMLQSYDPFDISMPIFWCDAITIAPGR
jgi:hypothetical protein